MGRDDEIASFYDEADAYIKEHNLDMSVEQLEKELEKRTGFSMSEFDDRMDRTQKRMDGLSDEERVSPDTYGAECVFLRFFVNEKMSEDFSLIARDFLAHEHLNLEQYFEPRYLKSFGDDGPPTKIFQSIVLNLMYNAYKSGSIFAKEQFKYLYKTYYKKEYNRIKKFNIIKYNDLLNISYNGQSNANEIFIIGARILTIGKMFDNICIDAEDSLFFYLFLDDWNKSLDEKKDAKRVSLDDEELEAALDIIWGKYEEDDRFFDYRETLDLALMSFSDYADISPTYIFECEDDINDTHDLLNTYIYALALYMSTSEKKEFTSDEIHLIVATYRLANAMFDNSYEIYGCLRDILGGPIPKNISEKAIYHAGKIKSNDVQSSLIETVNKHQNENKTNNEQDKMLLSEINSLREKIRSLENNEKFYLDTIAEKEKTIKANGVLLGKYQEEHDELVALRDYVYRLTEADTNVFAPSYDEMKESISKKHIVIIGGHDNWVLKMKQEFPNWRFVSPSTSGVVDKGIVKNADKVYFFTDVLKHRVYYRYIDIIRTNKVPFGYIHGVNINMNIEQIFEEMN